MGAIYYILISLVFSFLMGCSFYSSYESPSNSIVGEDLKASEVANGEGGIFLPSSENGYVKGHWFYLPSDEITSLPAPDLELTPEVQREINYFVNKDPYFISRALTRAKPFLPTLKEIFRDEGVPLELLAIAMIESGFKSNARSRSGAVGIWQFMKPTASVYGLKVGFWSDQRKDPILSTIAAAKHLKDLYLAFADWNLALAAYNAGSGRIDRTISRANTRNFWNISRRGFLRKETRRYVPKFIAVNMILSDPEKFNYKLDYDVLNNYFEGLSDGE